MAELIVSEMLEAATAALGLSVRLEDRGDLLRNVDALRAFQRQCLNRQRGSKLDASPLLN